MLLNCRGNPLWLPILRAATEGRPYIYFFREFGRWQYRNWAPIKTIKEYYVFPLILMIYKFFRNSLYYLLFYNRSINLKTSINFSESFPGPNGKAGSPLEGGGQYSSAVLQFLTEMPLVSKKGGRR